jgi:hypothetical protein
MGRLGEIQIENHSQVKPLCPCSNVGHVADPGSIGPLGCETSSMLITSNHALSDWDSIFAHAMRAVATIDRLIHHGTIIKIEAQRYRKISFSFGRSNMIE